VHVVGLPCPRGRGRPGAWAVRPPARGQSLVVGWSRGAPPVRECAPCARGARRGGSCEASPQPCFPRWRDDGVAVVPAAPVRAGGPVVRGGMEYKVEEPNTRWRSGIQAGWAEYKVMACGGAGYRLDEAAIRTDSLVAIAECKKRDCWNAQDVMGRNPFFASYLFSVKPRRFRCRHHPPHRSFLEVSPNWAWGTAWSEFFLRWGTASDLFHANATTSHDDISLLHTLDRKKRVTPWKVQSGSSWLRLWWVVGLTAPARAGGSCA